MPTPSRNADAERLPRPASQARRVGAAAPSIQRQERVPHAEGPGGARQEAARASAFGLATSGSGSGPSGVERERARGGTTTRRGRWTKPSGRRSLETQPLRLHQQDRGPLRGSGRRRRRHAPGSASRRRSGAGACGSGAESPAPPRARAGHSMPRASPPRLRGGGASTRSAATSPPRSSRAPPPPIGGIIPNAAAARRRRRRAA